MTATSESVLLALPSTAKPPPSMSSVPPTSEPLPVISSVPETSEKIPPSVRLLCRSSTAWDDDRRPLSAVAGAFTVTV
jgi:hypothetical protein